MTTTTTIHNVQELITFVDNLKYVNDIHAHVRAWFRGQSDVSWKLAPGVYRDLFRLGEDEPKWRTECHLTQDFQVEAASVLSHPVDPTQLYFLQQHYRMPTRLLDWTSSPLTALYFACADPKVHGAVFMMDAYQLAPHQKADPKEYRGIALGSHPKFQECLENIWKWKFPPVYPPHIMAVRPDHFDARIASQRSYFTFHVPNAPELTQNHNKTLHHVIIDKDCKGDIIKQLFRLAVDEFSIYRDLDHLSLRLKFAYDLK